MIIRLTLLLIFLVAPMDTNLAEDAWVLYYTEQRRGGPSLLPPKTFYYDRNSITQVEPNVYEVYHKESFDDKDMMYILSQYWFDCEKKMMAVGNTITYMAGEEFSSMNMFKAGFYKLREPYRGKIIDPQLLLMDILCKR